MCCSPWQLWWRRRTGNPKARLADFFDVDAGSGAGGMLVGRDTDDARRLFSVEGMLVSGAAW